MTKWKLTGKWTDLKLAFLTGKAAGTFEFNEKEDACAAFDELKDCAKLRITLEKHKEKRSKNANAYLWVLCEKLAEKIGCTKLDVYRQHILNVGIFEQAEINEGAVDVCARWWNQIGLGWLVERVDRTNHEGFVLLNLYCGSSVYDTQQMSRLLNSVIEDCKDQGIQTETPDKIAEMLSLWGDK